MPYHKHKFSAREQNKGCLVSVVVLIILSIIGYFIKYGTL